jgi:transposase
VSVATLGIDVSKGKLDSGLWLKATRKRYSSKAGNDPAGANRLVEWACLKASCSPAELRVVLEATGVYHELVAEVFHDRGCQVVIANPKRVRDFANGIGILGKTDAIDAQVLARYGSDCEDLEVWVPPPAPIRVLRALVARLDAVEQDLRREENRLEKADSTDTPAVVRDSLQRSLASLRAERERLLKAIEDHYDDHPDLKQERERLKTIPGVGNTTANRMLCLLRRQRFHSARQAAAYAGLNVIPYRSGTSVYKRPHLSKAGDAKFKAAMYMAALVAARFNPPLRKVYLDLTGRGKAKMSALGALMRRLVHIAYGMLKHQTDFNPALVAKNI